MDDDDDDDGGDNWKENWKNDAERDFEAVFGKDTALLHDDDSDGSSIDSYEDDSIHSSVSLHLAIVQMTMVGDTYVVVHVALPIRLIITAVIIKIIYLKMMLVRK